LRGASGLLAYDRTSARAGPKASCKHGTCGVEGLRANDQAHPETDAGCFWPYSAALSLRELNSQAARVTCGSGFSREESNAVRGTGCAGVRG